jgi:hypothetical protein
MSDEARRALDRSLRESRARRLEAYEVAVERSYAAAVTAEEYNAKVTPTRTTQIALYMMGTDYSLDLFDDTSDEPPNSTVQLLYDFMAFTNLEN